MLAEPSVCSPALSCRNTECWCRRRSRSDSTAVLPPRSGGEAASSRGRYPALVSPRAQQGPTLPLSPFQASSISRDSAESMDSQVRQPPGMCAACCLEHMTLHALAAVQGHAVRKSFGSSAPPPQASSSEVAWLRQQLEDRDVQVASLQEEVKHLKLQLAALQGSSSPGRVMLPAS